MLLPDDAVNTVYADIQGLTLNAAQSRGFNEFQWKRLEKEAQALLSINAEKAYILLAMLSLINWLTAV